MEKSPEQRKFPEKLTVAENFAVRTAPSLRRVLEHEIRDAVTLRSQFPSEPWKVGLRVMYNEMVFPESRKIKEVFQYAAKNGAQATLIQDVGYSRNVLDLDLVPLRPDWTLKGKKNKHRLTRRGRIRAVSKGRVRQLREAGVKVYDTYPLNPLLSPLLPFFNRDHMHLAYIVKPNHDMVAWIQSQNNARVHYERMLEANVEFTDPAIAGKIIEEFSRFGPNRREHTEVIECTEGTRLVVGPGKENLKYFIDIVDQAKKRLYVTSAFPFVGKFLKALNEAKERGVEITAVVNSNRMYGAIAKGNVIRERHNPFTKREFPVRNPGNMEMHAKTILIDPGTPQQMAVIGTDNFIGGGHEEISAISSNPTLVHNLRKWYINNIGWDNLESKISGDTSIILPKVA